MSLENPPVPFPKQFPIHPDDHTFQRQSVPWDFVAPHEAQALKNHGQTLGTLAERGGLSLCELLAVVEGRRWREMPRHESSPRLDELLAAWNTPGPTTYESRKLVQWVKNGIAGWVSGAQIRVYNDRDKVLGTVARACPEEGWLEVWVLGGDGKVVADRKARQLVSARVHTGYTLVDRRDETILHHVRWSVAGELTHEDLRGRGVVWAEHGRSPIADEAVPETNVIGRYAPLDY